MKPFEARTEKMRGPAVEDILRSRGEVSPQGLRILSWMAYNVGNFVPTEDFCHIVAPKVKEITPNIVKMTWMSISHTRAYINEKKWGIYSLTSPSGYFLISQAVVQENEGIVHLKNFRSVLDGVPKTPDYNELIKLCRTMQSVCINQNKDVLASTLLNEYLYDPLLSLIQARIDRTSVSYEAVPGYYWTEIKHFLYTYDTVWDLHRTKNMMELVKRE